MLEPLIDAVRSYTARHANLDGLAGTAVPGLRMMRRDQPGQPLHSVYRPLVCLVLQGAKDLTAGREERRFEGGQAAIVGVDLPVIGHVVRASAREPYLAIAIELDMAVMQEVAAQAPGAPVGQGATGLLFADNLDEDILSAARRLMRLIDHPEADPILRPSVQRELQYWLLRGPHGPALRRLALPDGATQQVTRAIDLLRAEFQRAVPVEELATAAGMSPSAFHRHFKAVTSLSPLQFQKRLRLIEARRIMLNDGFAAGRAGFEVGYESASQFTRDYARMFGSPPRRHIADEVSRTRENTDQRG